MIFQIIILAVLLICASNLLLNVALLKRPSRSSMRLLDTPFVSILVPARNEEKNIKACVESLQKQEYPDYEIIILDDNSFDATAAVVESIQAGDARVRLLRGKPLPSGWAGKPFACQQLARAARGSWMLFTDADTIHEPHMLNSVMSVAIEQKLSLMSGMPRQIMSGLAQKIVMPFMYFILLSMFPIWFLNRTRRPWPTLAIGQFMLFPREEYWRVGGHEAVKSRIIEDVWFGAEIKRAGGRFICVDLSQVMSTDMYNSVPSMIEGWGKWFYSVIAMSPLLLFGLFAVVYLIYLAPFFWLANGLLMQTGPADWTLICLAQVLVVLVMRWAVDNRFKEPAISFIFHPLGVIFLILVALYTTAKKALGVGIAWKDRVYDSKSNIK